MYGIDIFDSIKLELDWYIIYYGIKHNLLGIESAREYVFKKLKENETLSEEEFANLRESEKNISKLFEKINLIYEVFDYPFDMESFISYMPTDDDYIPKEHTQEENEKRLLSRLDSFIHEQIRLYII